MAASGARVAVPRGEAGYFAGADNFWRNRPIYDNDTTYNDFFAPTTTIPADRELVGDVDGRRVAITGDVIHHAAKPWTLFDLEWSYRQQTGLGSLSLTLQTLAGLDVAAVLPSHGRVIDNPATACAALNAQLAIARYASSSTVGGSPTSATPWAVFGGTGLWRRRSAFLAEHGRAEGGGRRRRLDRAGRGGRE